MGTPAYLFNWVGALKNIHRSPVKKNLCPTCLKPSFVFVDTVIQDLYFFVSQAGEPSSNGYLGNGSNPLHTSDWIFL